MDNKLIVRYKNDINNIPLRKFKPVEMNLLFTILSQMQNEGTKTVRFSLNELQKLSNYKPTAKKRFTSDIINTYQKILGLHFGWQSADGLRGKFVNLFSKFKYDFDKHDYIDIQISNDAVPLLNDLTQWVRFSLPEFNSISSSYAKTAFRLFKQFRTVGRLYLDKTDFIELFDVPKSYRAGNIDQFILKPIKLELASIFPNLKITKKYSNHRGKPIIGYEFTWKPESSIKNDLNAFSNKQNIQNVNNINNNKNLSSNEKSQATNHLINRIYTNYKNLEEKQAKSSNVFDGTKYQSQSQIKKDNSESTSQSQVQLNNKNLAENKINEFINNSKKSNIDKLKATRDYLLNSKKIVKIDDVTLPMTMRKKLANKIDKEILKLVWQESDNILDKFMDNQNKE